MKFLLFIFSLYLLALPCIPCMDKLGCNSNTEQLTKSVNTSQEHEHEQEACSPFCNCACCFHTAIPNFQMSKFAVANGFPLQKQQYFYNHITISSSISGNIWQPPRLT